MSFTQRPRRSAARGAKMTVAATLAFAGGGGAMLALETAQGAGAATTSSTDFIIPAGVEVVQTVAVGAHGGSADGGGTGGLGCAVTGSIPVTAGDHIFSAVGTAGGSSGTPTPGAGGSGIGPDGIGGDGGTSTSIAGAGGGGISLMFDVSSSLSGFPGVIAAGGGGAGADTGADGGSACNSFTGAGGDGVGGSEDPNSGGLGATTTSVGGAGGTGVSNGGDGNSFTGSDGHGGTGGGNASANNGGGGGGGGASGGGGGASQSSAGSGGGGAGLSFGYQAATLAVPQFSWTTDAPSIAINYIDISATSLIDAKVGTAYSAAMSATFGASTPVTGTHAVWSVSPALPAGLSMDPRTGAITGTPTAGSAATSYKVTAQWLVPVPVFDASVLGAGQATADIAAQSSVSLSLTVAAPAAPAVLAATGFNGELVVGAALLLIGVGAPMVAVRRRRMR